MIPASLPASGETQRRVSPKQAAQLPRRTKMKTESERLLPKLLPNAIARAETSRDKERFRTAKS